MALDEQLLDRNRTTDQEADGSEEDTPTQDYSTGGGQEDSADRAGSLRVAVQAQKNGLPQISSGNLREDKKNAERNQGGKAKQMLGAALSPAKQALSNLLKSAWENLISSWGLTLIWIDIHVFLSFVLGKELFCDLGEEWLPAKPGIKVGQNKDGGGQNEVIGQVTKSVGLIEKMGCGCLNLGCALLVFSALVQIALILNVITNPMSAIKALLGTLWGAITGTK